MKSDPFAPADSPRHIRNIHAAALLGEDDDPQRNRFAELLELHLTPHEQAANISPSIEEAERRQTLVDEFHEQLSTEGPDAELPTLEDATGTLYEWQQGDGDGSWSWQHVGLTTPPRNGPGSDTETWRAFAAAVTQTDAAGWASMGRGEIIAHLENNQIIASERQ